MRRDVRVLIVEDDHLAREMLKARLEVMEGYTPVGEAMDGVKAVELTRTLKPDVVLMDIQIPALDGLEAARYIFEKYPTPVVVLSAFETPDLIRQASEAGVGAYLIKPINANEMERAIAIAMARFDDMMNLRRLNRDLSARNEDLDAFAHAVAHDLQNPLALLIGFSEALRKYYDTLSEEDLETCLFNIENSSRKMSDIVDQLLLLAEARNMKVEMKLLSTADIVQRAQERLTDLIEERQAEITLPESWPDAFGHSQWVEEVWYNCLICGIRYSISNPPHLELGGAVLPEGEAQFWVREDCSKQEPEDEDDDLFALLQVPVDTKQSNRQKLRVSLVKRIVEKLGGKADMESTAEHGNAITFTLPGPDQAEKSSQKANDNQ